MKTTSVQIRINQLEQIAGLGVYCYFSKNGQAAYVFHPKNNKNFTLKTVFTYRKAKIFAEGVRCGVLIS